MVALLGLAVNVDLPLSSRFASFLQQIAVLFPPLLDSSPIQGSIFLDQILVPNYMVQISSRTFTLIRLKVMYMKVMCCEVKSCWRGVRAACGSASKVSWTSSAWLRGVASVVGSDWGRGDALRATLYPGLSILGVHLHYLQEFESCCTAGPQCHYSVMLGFVLHRLPKLY